MSVSGQSRRFDCVPPTSALPPSTDIAIATRQVRKVPQPDILRLWNEGNIPYFARFAQRPRRVDFLQLL